MFKERENLWFFTARKKVKGCTTHKITAVANSSTSDSTKNIPQTCNTDVSRVYFQSISIPVERDCVKGTMALICF